MGVILRLLKVDNAGASDLSLVTSAAGAIHAMVQGQGQKAYVPWVGGLGERLLADRDRGGKGKARQQLLLW